MKEKTMNIIMAITIAGIVIMACTLAVLVITEPDAPETVGVFNATKKVYAPNEGPAIIITPGAMEDAHPGSLKPPGER